MSGARAPLPLAVEQHYEGLRDRVWLRVALDDPRMPWASFEDAYQEVWTWITAQERAGRTVVAESGGGVAYLAQAVRRRYVDELRACRRGIGRACPGPVVEPLEEHVEHIADTGIEGSDDAREARRAVTAVYLLAHDRLSHRELQAFALSVLLELKPAEAARAMGVSPKRVRNLRWEGWRKIGRDVVGVLEGRLEWCDSSAAGALRARALGGDETAVALLRSHLAVCPTCTHSIVEQRRAAVALVPLGLVLDPGSSPQLLDAVVGWLGRRAMHAAHVLTAAPGAGRAALALTAVAAALVGGGAVLEQSSEDDKHRPPSERTLARPGASRAGAPPGALGAPARAARRAPTLHASPRPRRPRAERVHRFHEREVPAPAGAAALPPTRGPPPAPDRRVTVEFGFER